MFDCSLRGPDPTFYSTLLRTTTQTRLIALLCLIVAVFGGAYWALRNAHINEAERMVTNLRADRTDLVHNLLDLTGESLKNFASDYSYWDDMVQFVRTADAEWGRANLEVSLTTFHANGAWVLCPDGRQIYGTVRGLDASLAKLPVDANALVAVLRQEKFVHFFATTTAGLIEFRCAPVQPTADAARQSPPQGWLIVARLWDDAYVASLQRILEGVVTIDQPAQPVPTTSPMTVRIIRTLRDFQGRNVGLLRSDYDPKALALLVRDNENDKFFFGLFGVFLIGFITFSVSRWVLQPLARLEKSLETRSPAALGPLRREADIFGRLAKLIEGSFDQRSALEREVDERRRIETALRQSQQELRSAAELRTRLARDLHDGVIQSIYAAGLGLEGVRHALGHDAAAAERRLDAAQAGLNHTIREVRSFIQGLEPEQAEHADFRDSLQSLISTLRGLYPADILLRIAEDSPRLTPREEVHALQIVRESVSNAARHGNAGRIAVDFSRTDGAPCLSIGDDGRGFDLAVGRARGGSGLSNLTARAAEIGAQLVIETAPGTGTSVTVRFAPR